MQVIGGTARRSGAKQVDTNSDNTVIIQYHIFQLILDINVVRAIRSTNSYRIDGEGADTALLRKRQTRLATYEEKLVRPHHFKPHYGLGEARINHISSFGRR